MQSVDFSVLLTSVMAIADELDSQLAQQMSSYIVQSKSSESPTDRQPVQA
jgi:hypothetical protein